MGIRVTSLDELSTEQVDQLFAESTQLLQEKYPEVELTRGVFHDLLLYLSSTLEGLTQANIDKVLRSASLLEINRDPSLADDEIVDRVLSNHRVTRKSGSRSAGSITIVAIENGTVFIPADLVFTANGVEFRADTAFTGRPAGSTLLADTDRTLEPLGDGTYAFTIEVTAVTEGPEGNIRRGTKLVPEAIPNRFLTAYAAEDFASGFAAEINSELLDRLVRGDAAKTMGGRTNVEALIMAQPDFERTLGYSIIGYGDAEMQRDQHWLLPVSGGGRVDIYARTQALPRSAISLIDATLVEVTADGGVWQFPVDKDLSPGFYEVDRIALPNASPGDAGYAITMDLRGANLTDDQFLPDIASTEEAAYTRYQTSVIRFLDTDTPTTDLVVGTSTQTYEVSLLGMPLIAELQDFVGGREIRNPAADTLVKAAVPCFLTIAFDIRREAGDEAPDLDAIANAMADAVNHLGFTGQLHASLLASVVHEHLNGKQACGAMEMFGRIRRPDGTTGYVRDTSVLQIPDDPSRLVTGRTTAFILDPANVSINLVAAGFTNG